MSVSASSVRRHPARLLLLVVMMAIAGMVAILIGLPSAAADRPVGPPLAGRFAGVNLAGGEFKAKNLPGRYGYDYSYPDRRIAAPFVAAGMTAVRLPVRWERLQPVLSGPLQDSEMRRLDGALKGLSGFSTIIIDIHNYARYRKGRTDRDPAVSAGLADLWTRLATRYRTDPKIAFGLMNEPFAIAPDDWRATAERTVAAIRATGARNLILVPGTRWSGAHSWTNGVTGSNATAMAGFRDPGNNMAFELHQYLDADSSGTDPACVDPQKAAARLDAVTRWLRQEGQRGYLGEFGASADPICLAGLDAMLTRIDANADVWLGWTYWAAGARWGNYSFSVQPARGGAKPQMAVLLRHLPRRSR